ncbi:MAG: hypothetical protein CME61_03895 [Halobacteriovoraceae bacterium]|nr:hypothetical protein [Halobacteriovoraceae bacterium]
MFYVKKVFFVPSLAPASLNVMMIFSILVISGVLIRSGEEPVYALAIGGMSGGLLQLLVQVPFLIKNGIFEKISFVLFSPAVKKIIYRMSVGIIGVAATQINLLINTFLATGAGFGSVSYLTYSLRLFQFPVGIFGVSLSNSNLVFFSEAVKAGNIAKAKDSLKGSLELSMLVIIPVTCLLYILSEDLIYLVFERGAFSTNDRLMTSMAFKAYLFGLPFYCLFKLFGPTFYALDKEKIPVGISLFSILVNIVFCLSLVDEHGFVILALGASLSIIVNSLLQILFLKKELDLRLGFFVSKKLITFVFGSAVSLWILILSKSYFFLSENWSFGEKLIEVISLSSVFLICYSFALVIFGEKKILSRFINKIRRN